VQGKVDRTQRVWWMPQKPDTGGAISPSEPDALKGACPVREEVVGNVPKGNALATYFMKVVCEAPTLRSYVSW